MILRTTLSFSPLLLALVPALLPSSAPEPFAPQERAKKIEAKDFPALLTGAKAAWDAGQYGKASKVLKEASSLVSSKLRESLLAAFPAAPEGWTFKAPKQNNEAAAMMFGMAGMAIEGKYSGPEGASLNMTLTVDSPMVQMMSMAFANPALLGDGGEIIKYGKHQALLKKNGSDRYELSILIGDDLVQANSRKMTDDELLGVCSQAVVDKLAAALAN